MNRVKLPEICTIPITDGTHQTPTYTAKEDGIPFISSKDVTTKKIDWTNIKYITKDLHEQLYKRIAPQKNDILLAKNGTTGVAALVEDNRVFDIYVTLAVIRPDLEKVFPKYLLHVINSDYCKKQFSSHLVGIGVPNLHLKDINQTSIPLPSLPEQQKIAAHLDSIQRAVDNKKQQLQQLDELVKSKFVEMFGEIDNTPFDLVKLEDVTEFIKDGTHQTPTYTEDTINGYKFVSAKDVTSGHIDWSNVKYIPEELHKELYRRITPKRGDILLAKNGTIGKAAIVETEDIFDIYVSLAILRFKSGFNTIYLWAALNNDDSMHQYTGNVVGIGVPNLHLGRINKVKIQNPPIELQNTFAEYVQKIDTAKSIIKTQLVDLQELLDSKMDEYFGE